MPASDHVTIANPAAANPFSSASEIKVAGDDAGWIDLASGFGSQGEGVRLVRGRTGRIREVWIAGTKLMSERRAAAELKKTYES